MTIGGGGLGVFCAAGGRLVADTTSRISATLDVGLGVRALGGDITNPSNAAVRASIFGQPSARVGLEVGLQLAVSGLKAALTYYRFGGDVPGFSNGQVVAGFSVQSPLIKGTLN